MAAAFTFSDFVGKLLGQFTMVPTLLIAIAMAYFIYGVAEVILNSGNQEKLGDGKKKMLWGIIALFFMIAMWGLAAVLSNTFKLDNNIPKTDYVKP